VLSRIFEEGGGRRSANSTFEKRERRKEKGAGKNSGRGRRNAFLLHARGFKVEVFVPVAELKGEAEEESLGLVSAGRKGLAWTRPAELGTGSGGKKGRGAGRTNFFHMWSCKSRE